MDALRGGVVRQRGLHLNLLPHGHFRPVLRLGRDQHRPLEKLERKRIHRPTQQCHIVDMFILIGIAPHGTKMRTARLTRRHSESPRQCRDLIAGIDRERGEAIGNSYWPACGQIHDDPQARAASQHLPPLALQYIVPISPRPLDARARPRFHHNRIAQPRVAAHFQAHLGQHPGLPGFSQLLRCRRKQRRMARRRVLENSPVGRGGKPECRIGIEKSHYCWLAEHADGHR